MRGYPYEIRRYPLSRAIEDGRYLEANRLGTVVDRGVIDRATPETHEILMRALDRAAGEHSVGAHRFSVLWLHSPRGPHASLFRNMHRDVLEDVKRQRHV
jgi:hypothetical protein